MNKGEKIKLLTTYIKSNVAPILVDFISEAAIPNGIIIPANCQLDNLNGHYEKDIFVAPNWYKQITSNNNASILVISSIDSIPKEEQNKFIELLKYRQISTFELPKNCIIIITAKKISQETISDEIYSLVAHIEG